MADETDELPQSPQPFTTTGVRPPLQIDPAQAQFHTQGAVGPAPEPLPEPSFTAYHGSPYDFERFSSSQIGTGEGAQAYGHGLYFAGNPATALQYQKSLSQNMGARENDPYGAADRAFDSPQSSSEDAIANLQGQLAATQRTLDKIGPNPTGTMVGTGGQAEKYYSGMRQMYLAAIDAVKGGYRPGGALYQVQINADPEHFLDWDKALSEQPQKVKDFLAGPMFQRNVDQEAGWAKLTGEQFYNAVGERVAGTKEETTQALRAAGIPGIKYLDQGSRNTEGLVNLETKYRAANLDNSRDTSERFFASRFKENNGNLDATISHLQNDLSANPNDATVKKTLAFAQDPGNKFTFQPPANPTHNYVVFDDNLINIVKKNGLPTIVNNNQAHFKTTPVDHDPFGDE